MSYFPCSTDPLGLEGGLRAKAYGMSIAFKPSSAHVFAPLNHFGMTS
ncbi:hypothetical protein [Polaromonas sp.]|nr:hypothetical protein [Polaromonas sp.]